MSVVTCSHRRALYVVVGILLLGGGLFGCNDQKSEQKPTHFVDEPDTTGSDDANPTDTGIEDDTTIERDTKTDPGRPTGSACRDSSDCEGTACLASENYPGGYCTKIDCKTNGCSGGDSVCLSIEDGPKTCLDGCDSDEECRDGYTCQDLEEQSGSVCFPGKPDPPTTFETTRNVLDVACEPTKGERTAMGTEYTFDFTIADNASGFLMSPYVTEGSIRPLTLKTPQRTVDIQNDYRHHNSRLTDVLGGDLTDIGTFGKVALDWPVVVPYAPRFADLAQPGGSYTLTVASTEEKPCLYVLDNTPGRTIDLNIYLVGANGLDAASAEDDTDLQAAISQFKHIYGKVGVKVDKLRYYDLPEDVVDRYERVQSREDAHRLMAHGKPPSDSLDGHLSVDVFLVTDLSIERNGSNSDVLGMSAGIPGAAGMHGNARNGLVFQTSDLGHANKHVGHIMAHEIGHFLGLRHTTEVVHGTRREEQVDRILGSTDPINDTEVCENILEKLRSNPFECKDFDNLMFPVAPPPQLQQDPRLTQGQGEAMRSNPLIHD